MGEFPGMKAAEPKRVEPAFAYTHKAQSRMIPALVDDVDGT